MTLSTLMTINSLLNENIQKVIEELEQTNKDLEVLCDLKERDIEDYSPEAIELLQEKKHDLLAEYSLAQAVLSEFVTIDWKC